MKTNKPQTDAPQTISNKEIAARCATFLRSKATRCAIPLNPDTLHRVTVRVGRKSTDDNSIDFTRAEIRAMVDRIYTIEGRKSDAKRATALDDAKPFQKACRDAKNLRVQKAANVKAADGQAFWAEGITVPFTNQRAAMKAYAREQDDEWYKAFDGLKGKPRQEAIAKAYSKYVWQGTQDGQTKVKVKKTVRNGKKTSKSVKTVKGQAKSAKLIAKDKTVENLRLENMQLKAKINEIFAALQEQGVVE
jgi:hypothetical protein